MTSTWLLERRTFVDEDTLRIVFAWHFQHGLQSMPVRLEHLVLGASLILTTLRVNTLTATWGLTHLDSNFSGNKWRWESYNSTFWAGAKLFSMDELVMKQFGALFAQASIIICLLPNFSWLIQAKLLLLTGGCQVKVQGSNCLPSPMFELNRKVVRTP